MAILPLGRMLGNMLEWQHEKLCKPVLKPSFPLIAHSVFVVWQLACLLGCLAHCFPHVVYGICLWNSAAILISFFLQAVQVASFCYNLCFNPYSLLKDLFTSYICLLDLAVSIHGSFCLVYSLGKAVTLKHEQSPLRIHLSILTHPFGDWFLNWVSKNYMLQFLCPGSSSICNSVNISIHIFIVLSGNYASKPRTVRISWQCRNASGCLIPLLPSAHHPPLPFPTLFLFFILFIYVCTGSPFATCELSLVVESGLPLFMEHGLLSMVSIVEGMGLVYCSMWDLLGPKVASCSLHWHVLITWIIRKSSLS